jgi:nicotinate-nucleotide adenylyltransferase
MTKKLIGLLGMSGNPTHQGHIESAVKAMKEAKLAEVRLLINPHNPLKDPASYAPFYDRMQLAEFEVDYAGVGGQVTVSDYEDSLRNRGVPNETIWTLRHFERDHPGQEPVLIVGADIMATVHTWGGDWDKIFEEYPVIVLARPGDGAANALSPSVAERAFVHRALSPEMFACEKGTWTFLETANHPGSSTATRIAYAEGRRPRYVSPKSVSHTKQNSLYDAKS